MLQLTKSMAEMLQISLLHCHSLASPLNWACSPTRSTSSSGIAFSGSHSTSCRIRSSHLSSLTCNEVENPTNKIWRGAPRAQAEVRDQSVDDGLKWWERDLDASVRDLHSAQELTEAISAAEGKLIIVEFFASWCGSCRALYPKLCKLAAEHQDIVFVKINFDENKALCKSLNIKVLPYFHFYRGTSEQLESFSCSMTKLQKLKDAIAKYDAGGQHVNTEGSLEVGQD